MAAMQRVGKHRCAITQGRGRPESGRPLPCEPGSGWLPAAFSICRRNGNMRQRRIGFGAVPVALASLDMDHVAHVDLSFLMLRGDDATAAGDDEDLIARMGMPSGRGSWFKVNDTAAVV